MNPRVSLIVPCYNAGEYLRPFLLCVAAQTYRPLELVFTDDGSTDETPDVFGSMRPMLESSGISVVGLRIPHSGQAAAMNAGLAVFTGEYLTWADSDDLLCPQSVAAKADFLTLHPKYGMARHDAWNYEQGCGILTGKACKAAHRGLENIFEPLFRETMYCYAGCFMVRSGLFLRCYPDRRIPLSPEGQNLQMLLPPASRTACGWIAEPLMVYRIHSGSHAHLPRDHAAQLIRESEFCELRKKLLSYCECDRTRYVRLAEDIFSETKRKLIANAAASYRQRIEGGKP